MSASNTRAEALLESFRFVFRGVGNAGSRTAFYGFDEKEATTIRQLIGRAKRLRGDSEQARRLREVCFHSRGLFDRNRYQCPDGGIPLIDCDDIDRIADALFGEEVETTVKAFRRG